MTVPPVASARHGTSSEAAYIVESVLVVAHGATSMKYTIVKICRYPIEQHVACEERDGLDTNRSQQKQHRHRRTQTAHFYFLSKQTF